MTAKTNATFQRATGAHSLRERPLSLRRPGNHVEHAAGFRETLRPLLPSWGRKARSTIVIGQFAAAIFAFGALFAANCASAAAPGQSSGLENPVNYKMPKTERRGGFAMAINFGYGVSGFAGYPNEIAKVGDDAYRVSTGPALGSLAQIWFGGALRDWFVTGAGFAVYGGTLNQNIGSQVSVLFHVDLFPLYSIHPRLRDLGLSIDGGLGLATIVDKDDLKDPLAEGGSMSTIGTSIFWEPLRFWHCSAGPQLNYTHGFSQSLHVNSLTLGLRLSLYGVQPKKKKGRDASASSAFNLNF